MSITFKNKEHIRYMYEGGKNMYEIAEHIGISQPAVSKMLSQGRDIYIKKVGDTTDIYDVKLLWSRVEL